ncbi:hypothetical protein ACFQGT_05350 [Natrialbaceae archaeon GCM10025810]|uniref:hypothetical protein n=1 Tax=Halovalidus salilacus TaxID=3075124 RepID=UPI003608019B
MSRNGQRREIPAPVGVILIVALVGVVVYGFLTGRIFALAVSAIGLGVSLYGLHLFYRLVVAVERIAEKL